ncbi:hypothetical protein ACFV4P_02985 [Kitasatospora sp. NPDC059795]|uniref:hypothetical protein n=1 Tax=Kitasatospora sp. NPDC059795 TaxID=3346949 RepID=UPI0036467A60
MSAVLQEQLPGLETVRRVVQPATGTARQQTIQERFEQFHALNGWVLADLERLTAECIDAKFTKVSLGMLFELVRYSYGRATLSADDDFRLNNDYRSRYARLLIEQHPEWAPYFEVRALRAD